MSSDWRDDLEAPSAPPESDESTEDASEVIAPAWVQRFYGPPPVQNNPSLQPIPATVWVPSGNLTPPPPYPYQAATPYHPPAYQLHAYTPGMAAVRSPSSSTFQVVGDPSQGNDREQQKGSQTSRRESQMIPPGKHWKEENAKPPSTPGGTMPSRAAALHARRQRQLRTFNKDAFGVPLPKTSRPFSIFASPFAVAEVCTGLGVYLASLQAAVILAFLLSLCAIYPMINNASTQRWASEYSLYTAPISSSFPAATCPKGWDLTSWITELTIGGHCTGTTYTSRYDCAARCVWTPDRLKKSQCRGVPPPGRVSNTTAFAAAMGNGAKGKEVDAADYITTLSGRCAQHLPCMKRRLDPYAPDGPCYCCRMELDGETATANPRVSSGQLWTFFVAQLVFLAWMLFLVHTQIKAVMIQGSRVVGASDFSVWISGIKRRRAEDAPLAHWCGHFGAIVAAFNIPSAGDALRVGRRVSDLLIRKGEAEALEGSTSCNPLQWVYRQCVVGRLSAISDSLDRQQRKLVIYERQESEPTGQALATFEYSESAAACVAEFDRPPLRCVLDFVTLGLTDRTPRLHGTTVRVVRAPEPSDILWEHTNCTGREAFMRRLWAWIFTALIVLAGAAIQYGLVNIAERSREDRMLAEYAAGTGAKWAVEEAAKQKRKLRWLAVLSGTVVVVINVTIILTMRALSWYERWTTRTSMERWIMVKLSVSQLLNAFAAPVLAAYAANNKAGWYTRGGLMEAAFFVQCANSMVPPLFHLLGLGDCLKYYILSPFARTQPMLDRLLAPPLFPLAEQHAASVTTLGLAMWYMPVLPISPVIALVGLTVSYCSNKYVALRRAAAPPNLSGMVTSSLNWLLRVLPLVQLVLMRYLYYSDYPAMMPVFYTGLSFWLLFCLAPIRALLGAVRLRRRSMPASGVAYHRLLGGKRLGTADVYAPLVPKPCSRKFKERLAATFALLAPAAFESIINGEEVAAAMFGNGRTDSKTFPAASHAKQDKHAAHGTVRASIAARVQGTLAMLWEPRDVECPENEFVSRKRDSLKNSRSASSAAQSLEGERHAPALDGAPLSSIGSVSASCDGLHVARSDVHSGSTPIPASVFVAQVRQRHLTPHAGGSTTAMSPHDVPQSNEEVPTNASFGGFSQRQRPRHAAVTPRIIALQGDDLGPQFRPLGSGLRGRGEYD